jgi:hypothetical protein
MEQTAQFMFYFVSKALWDALYKVLWDALISKNCYTVPQKCDVNPAESRFDILRPTYRSHVRTAARYPT